MYKNKTVGLALGGGGACGFAHIGVLKALEDQGIIPDYICGTSMGSIIGALYSMGLTTEDMLYECKKLKFFKLFDINPLVIKNNFLISGKLVEKYLRNITREKTFEQLKTKFSCMATDLVSGKEYEFTSGPVWLGVRASISIPGLFKPVEYEDMILVDGGVLNNVPTQPIEKYKPDIIIACDVLNKYVMQQKPSKIWEVFFYSFNLLQNRWENAKLKKIKYKIAPDTTKFSALTPSIKPLDELYNEGYNSAQKVIKKIKRDIEKSHKE